MGKSHFQAVYEAKIRAKASIGHPAAPIDGGAGWQITCQRSGCESSFLSVSRHRKYCSVECRRQVEDAARRRQDRVEHLVDVHCQWRMCQGWFIPTRRTQRFCSARCRQLAYVDASRLRGFRCERCGQAMDERTSRAKFCSVRCRVSTHRSTVFISEGK